MTPDSSSPRPPTPDADLPTTASHGHAKALLAELGPARALGILAALTHELGAKSALPPGAVPWDASAAAMAQLASALHTGAPVHAAEADGDDDGTATDGEDEEKLEAGDDPEDADDDGTDEDPDAEEDETGDEADASEAEDDAPPAPRAHSRRRRVAGIVEPGPRVLSCRVRVVHESGTRGELVGRTNAQGIEETEWPLATMTPEFFRHLTRRGGQFMFEWFGRDDSGKRVGLGRSSSIRVRGDAKTRPERARAVPAVAPHAAPPSMGFGLEQFLAFQRYQDERSDQERTRRERAQAQAMETQRHQSALASKERIRKMEIEAELAKTAAKMQSSAAPEGARLDEHAVRATIARQVKEGIAEAMPKKDSAFPAWLVQLGVTPETLATVIPAVMAKLQESGPKPPPSNVAPVAPPVGPYTPRFVPSGGTG